MRMVVRLQVVAGPRNHRNRVDKPRPAALATLAKLVVGSRKGARRVSTPLWKMCFPPTIPASRMRPAT